MEFRLLGLLEVRSDGGDEVQIGPGKESALLAALLLRANEPVSTDRLVEDLWDDAAPANAAKTIQVYVSRLRKRLDEGRLVTTAGGYLLRTDPAELDVERFERLTREGRRQLESGAPGEAAESLADALALWRGPALADFGFDRFAQEEIRRLEKLRDAAVSDCLDARLADGEAEPLLPELERLARGKPLDERLQGQLMLCLYRCGRQAEALGTYTRARTALVGELGVEPGRRLRDLQQAILVQDPQLDVPARGQPPMNDPPRPFVGRARELAELESSLDAALTGRGRLALVIGEPGIGKSRLMEELAARARARGATVLVGRCWEAGGAPAYWPWVQSLRDLVRTTDARALREQLGAGAGEIAQVLPELGEMFGDLPEPTPSESEGARFRLFDAITQFLAHAGKARPIVLCLDDLHAADAPSLLLLQFLARELSSARLMVLGGCRDVDPVPAGQFASVLAELSREPAVVRVPLHGLDKDAVGEYVERTAAELASSELAEALTEKTEGNPLFVGEMLRLLVTERAGAARAAAALAVPPSLREVISWRLNHLSESCARLLPLAAVLGREFPLDVLARMGTVDEDDLLDSLDEAIAARVVADLPGLDNRLRFAHVLIRDTLYEGLTAARRIRYHRMAVEALEAIHGEVPGPHLAELALHALAASDLEKALGYAHRAGDRAFALLAYEEAARLYDTALGALEASRPDDDAMRCEVLLALGEAKSRAGDSPGAKSAFLDASVIAERLGLERALARAAIGYGGRLLVVRAGRDDRLVPLLERALQLLPEDEIELRGRLLGRLAGAIRDEHSRERRDKLSREAVALARRTGSDVALAYALDGRIAAIVGADTIDECLALGEELCVVGERIGDRERLLQGYAYRMMANLTLGDMEAALVDVANEHRLARALAQPAQLWQVMTDDIALALASGRLEEATELSEKALSLGERAIPELAVPIYVFERYLLCDLRGQLDQVEPAIREVVAAHPARRIFACALAHVHARQGRRAEAERELDELAQDSFRVLPFDQEWLMAMSLLADTVALLGREDLAAPLYGAIAPFGALNAVDLGEGTRGPMARYLGQLAAVQRNWEAAVTHYDDALTAAVRTGALVWSALTRADYARMLRARAAHGDRKRADELSRAAATAFVELGISGYSA